MPHDDVSPLRADRPPPGSGAVASDPLGLADGKRLRFRPISVNDRDRLARFHAGLSLESRRSRFRSPKPELSPRELTYLTDIDHVTHEAIAAVDERDDSIVGAGRYAQFAGRPGVADVAVAVTDELQRMGIGTALARRVVQRAGANALVLLTASTQWENRPARALLLGLGFRARASDGSEIDFELQLEPTNDCCRPGCIGVDLPRVVAPDHGTPGVRRMDGSARR